MPPKRTPEQHRQDVERWRANAPQDDWKILNDGWSSKWQGGSSRHSKLAEQLAPLLDWMRRPEGILPGEEIPDSDISKTNWSLVPDNDNQPQKGHREESGLEIVPSLDVIIREMTKDQVRDGAGLTVRIGSLRFSDGTQFEKVPKWDGLKVVNSDVRLAQGRMIGCKEKQTRIEGSAADPLEISISNGYFNDLFGVKPRAYKTGRRNKEKGRNYTQSQSVDMLSEAWRNTEKSKVTFIRYPDGLPAGTRRISDNFIGMKKSTCAGGGSQSWEDICTSIVNREIWASAIAALPKEHIDTLQQATTAKSLGELGSGHHQRSKEKTGKKRLVAANDNFREIMKKLSS